MDVRFAGEIVLYRVGNLFRPQILVTFLARSAGAGVEALANIRKMAAKVLYAVSLSILLVACGGGSGSGSGSGSNSGADTTKLTVLSSASKSTGALSVTFSETIDPTTCRLENFHVVGPEGIVPGTLTCIGAVAAFETSAPLEPEAKYRLTITTGFRGMAGNPLVADYNYEFATADRKWSAPQLFGLDSLDYASDPVVTVDQNGNAIAVWNEQKGGQCNILASHYTPHVGWQAAQAIATETFGTVCGYVQAVNSNGHVLTVWGEYDSNGSAKGLWVNVYSSELGWQTPQRLDPIGPAVSAHTQGLSSPKLAVNEVGAAVAAWVEFEGEAARYSLWSSTYTPSGGWGLPSKISDSRGLFEIGFSNIAIDGSGNSMAVWNSFSYIGSSSGSQTWTNHYSPGEGWGRAEPIDFLSGHAPLSSLALIFDSAGRAMFVWAESGLYAARYVPGTGWTAPMTVDESTNIYLHVSYLDFDNRGNGLLLWHRTTYDGRSYKQSIRTSRFE